jgi:hypothetical protein
MVAEFVESSTQTRSGFRAFETAHGSVSSLDPAMVLLDPIIQILVGAVFHAFVQLSPDRARITMVTVRRDTRGVTPVSVLAERKKRLRRLHVAGLAQPDVDERTETIDGAIKVTPPANHFDVRLVNVPAFSDPALAPPPKVIDQGWSALRLPITDGFVTEFDASDQEHFRQVAQTQLVAETLKDQERDDVGWVRGPVQNFAASFIELLATGVPPEPPVALGGLVRPLRNLLRVARDATHFPIPTQAESYAGQRARRSWRDE